MDVMLGSSDRRSTRVGPSEYSVTYTCASERRRLLVLLKFSYDTDSVADVKKETSSWQRRQGRN